MSHPPLTFPLTGALPLYELAALGAATSWAFSGILVTDAVRTLGPFRFNLYRQAMVAGLLLALLALTSGLALPAPATALTLVLSGLIGILLGDTFNYAAIARIGPRRTGAIFALNAPFAALLAWPLLGERLSGQAIGGIALASLGVALAVWGRPRADAHRFEALPGGLTLGIFFGLLAALGQAGGALIARPVMVAGFDPYAASLLRTGASGLCMAALLPLAPPAPGRATAAALLLTLLTAIMGLLIGMTLFLYALKASQTGVVATLSATTPVLILPLLWLRTGQRPSALSALGAGLAVLGLSLLFTR